VATYAAPLASKKVNEYRFPQHFTKRKKKGTQNLFVTLN